MLGLPTPAGRLLLGAPPAAAAPAYLLRATFTAPNGTALTSYTPEVGGPFTARNDAFEIASNRASPVGASGGDPRYVATADVGAANYTLAVTARITAAGVAAGTDAGAVVRWATDGANAGGSFFIVTLLPAGTFAIYQRSGGAYTLRASAAAAVAGNTDYRIVVTVAGASISATLDGGTPINYGSATLNQTSTHCGFRVGDASAGRGLLDLLEVTP